MAVKPSAIFTIIPKAEVRDLQVKDLYHGELVLPQLMGELVPK